MLVVPFMGNAQIAFEGLKPFKYKLDNQVLFPQKHLQEADIAKIKEAK